MYCLINDPTSPPVYCTQVTVKVGDVVKGTAATEGEENPDWEETIEFAVPGDVVERQDAQVSLLRACFHHCEVAMSRSRPLSTAPEFEQMQMTSPARR